MRNRISFTEAENAVGQKNIILAIAEVISRGAIAEVKVEPRPDGAHVTVVSQSRELVEDIRME